MTRWQWYWAAWLVIGFLLPETWALLTGSRNTLSDTVWSWFGVREGVPIWQWNVLHLVLFAFMVWLLGHMAFRIWP
ncbi:hypothetical protein [Actinacidiphila oryziradicis]|uniref:hypothetical protein n=1 Tax=Actinacidiphila oryziradicis TaxID=2571141 RepID=UPI00145EEE2D|nr:hypothetical protein [Actinacidiphila oryziradicis]